MAQEVYKNNQGQVLFGNSGNVFKRPYCFGNAFLGKGISYIKISGLDISYNSLSVLTWCSSQWLDGGYQDGASGHFCFTDFNDNNKNEITWIYKNSIKTRINNLDRTGSNQWGGPLTFSGNLSVFSIENLQKLLWRNASGPYEYVLDPTFEVSNYKEILLGGARTTTEGNVMLAYYGGIHNMEFKINRFVVYSRPISKNEVLFIYNNGLGNSLMTTDFLDIDLDLSRAFILDFSDLQDGSDMRVGVRDHSGNNHHGEIMNLPAGTLQEQLDWANANLFVPFIS